jgi:hypothetical protein
MRLEADIQVDPCVGHAHYAVRHPSLLRPMRTTGPKGREKSFSGRQKIAEQVVALFSAQLVSDIQAAQQLSASIGADFFLHREMLRLAKPKATDADVAFNP